MEGKQIGNFRIVQKLGEGGMGVVYKGIDVQLDRPVAIKMLNVELSRNPELVQRFQAEARAQANLNHPNVATLYAFVVTDDGACMVMEFVEGDSFEQVLRRGGPMNPRDVVPLFKQALLGIGAAHRMGIVHRDIKPANLMVNRQGIVKVMDFGIAKAMGTRGMTRTGMQMGTILYMSPEQIQSRTIDVRTDIYALGVTLYEMLCGHVPFESESDFQVMHDHVNTPPPPLTRYYPYVAREFENVVAKALEKNPDNRFQTVEEFGAALEHPESVPPPVFSYAPPPPAMRGTTIEQRPVSAAGYGAGPAVAPGFTTVQGVPPPGTPPYGTAPGTPPYGTAPGMQPGFTPPPYGTAPGAQPGFTPPYGTAPGVQPGFTPPPIEGAPGVVAPTQSATRAPMSGRNKVILGAAAVAVVVLLAIVLWPKGTTTGGGGTAGGGGGGSTGTQLAGNTSGPAPGGGAAINVVKGDAATPGSNSTASSSGAPAAAGASGTAATAKDVRTPKQKTPPTPVKQQPNQVQPPQQPQQPQPQPTPQAQQPQPQPTPPPQPQPTPPPQPTPQPQPTPPPRQAQSFPVKHRHVVMNGFQSYTFFCGGWLSIRPDGSVTYVCTGTNDPSGRCDKVMFPAGSIKQAKMKTAGELHIQTSGMGNWDFFDLNIAGATASAYQAILSMGR